MVTVAALGFGDIPAKAFIEAFNIKESFFDSCDTTGCSRMIRELTFSIYLDVYHIERYQHHLSIEGRKNASAPLEFLSAKGIAA